MSCSGLHCAGCGAGAAAPPVALAGLLGLTWVAGHLIEVAAVSSACGVLSVAAVVALMRWQDRANAFPPGARCSSPGRSPRPPSGEGNAAGHPGGSTARYREPLPRLLRSGHRDHPPGDPRNSRGRRHREETLMITLITSLFRGTSEPAWTCSCGQVNPVRVIRCCRCGRW